MKSNSLSFLRMEAWLKRLGINAKVKSVFDETVKFTDLDKKPRVVRTGHIEKSGDLNVGLKVDEVGNN
jgi:hypothetical protein